jgi:hypothetical protein
MHRARCPSPSLAVPPSSSIASTRGHPIAGSMSVDNKSKCSVLIAGDAHMHLRVALTTAEQSLWSLHLRVQHARHRTSQRQGDKITPSCDTNTSTRHVQVARSDDIGLPHYSQDSFDSCDEDDVDPTIDFADDAAEEEEEAKADTHSTIPSPCMHSLQEQSERRMTRAARCAAARAALRAFVASRRVTCADDGDVHATAPMHSPSVDVIIDAEDGDAEDEEAGQDWLMLSS